ncbi:hypothetical protein I7I50_03792 [Histoplasma capsulatum G186AR]|uniref:Uncharacterized protein n=1 Tax=Ajellomyces capsulatus TaxID=5037 RepID=A0A8H8CXB2_AJECA|nr:hypothetical protein I7I52_04699 [Histoplasma capsulatum]QSS74856.1 hypothetical protein I7I50_03792 [Histoplasma capsulatum G186AR]
MIRVLLSERSSLIYVAPREFLVDGFLEKCTTASLVAARERFFFKNSVRNTYIPLSHCPRTFVENSVDRIK